MHDLFNLETFKLGIGPATHSATVNGPIIDLFSYQGVVLCVAIGAGGIVFDNNNRIDLKLLHSVDGVVFEPVADYDMRGGLKGIVNGIIRSFNTPQPAAETLKFGYVRNRQYIRLAAEFNGTHSIGTPLAVIVALGYHYTGVAE